VGAARTEAIDGLPALSARALPASGPRLARLGAILAVQLFSLACIHGERRSEVPLVPQPVHAGHTHVVAPGETLYRIALKEGVPVEELQTENGIDDPTQLEVGRSLFIPGRGAGSAAPASPALDDSSARRGGGLTVEQRDGATPRLLWPVRGVIFSAFGQRGSEHHDGLDLAAPKGTPIVAAADGTVLFAGEQRGYGQIILVEHAGDLITVYAHNSENLVARGDHVQRGQPIAKVGATGNATGPHVHFEVRVAAHPQDPLNFLR